MNSNRVAFNYSVTNADIRAFRDNSRAYKRKRALIRLIWVFVALASSYGLVMYFILAECIKALQRGLLS